MFSKPLFHVTENSKSILKKVHKKCIFKSFKKRPNMKAKWLIILLKATSLLQYDYISHIYIWIISNEYRLYSPTVHPYCVFYLLVARFISKSASFYPKLGNKSIDFIILTRWQFELVDFLLMKRIQGMLNV